MVKEDLLTLNTYLRFNGSCREAFEFYRSVFGGEFAILEPFRNGPPDMGLPEEELDNVMHVSYPIGPSVLMGSDVPSIFGPPTVVGNNFSISYSTRTKEETDDLFAKISEGGRVTMAPEDRFWGAYFGSCTDKFGVNWQFTCEQQGA